MDTGRQFTLQADTWYACEFIGDEFDKDACSCSPIKVHEFAPAKTGKRIYSLHFYQANYPEGVREQQYTLRITNRGQSILLAKSLLGKTQQFLLIHAITPEWVSERFNILLSHTIDMQDWLEKNA
jgi:hypothetical protein